MKMDLDNNYNNNEVFSEEVKSFGLSRLAKMKSVNGSACGIDSIPAVHEYLAAIGVYGTIWATIAGLLVISILWIFIDTFRYIMKNSSPRVKAHSAFIIGVYPVVALATFCAIIVPRSHLLAEAVTQGIFMAGMYQLFCLLVAYCGGEAELIRKVKPATLNLKVGPCCCWPCCFCLPALEINKNRIRQLRMLVLQLPVVQGLVYLTLLVMWAERESLYHINYFYVQPLIILSILFGVWAMSITLNLLRDVLKDHSTIGKFFVLQMVLIFGKFQNLIMKAIVWAGLLPCHPPITPGVYGYMIYNSLMLVEMLMLGLIARKLYKRDLPNPDGTLKSVSEVHTFSNRISTIGAIVANENNNTVFACNNNKQSNGNSRKSSEGDNNFTSIPDERF